MSTLLLTRADERGWSGDGPVVEEKHQSEAYLMMVVCKRRKTCFVGSNPFSAIPEDVESNSSSERRDSVESSSSGGSSDGRGVTWTRGPDHDPLQGDWTLISNNNFDQFLAVNGAGPLSSNMVLRARINMVIKQVSS